MWVEKLVGQAGQCGKAYLKKKQVFKTIMSHWCWKAFIFKVKKNKKNKFYYCEKWDNNDHISKDCAGYCE